MSIQVIFRRPATLLKSLRLSANLKEGCGKIPCGSVNASVRLSSYHNFATKAPRVFVGPARQPISLSCMRFFAAETTSGPGPVSPTGLADEVLKAKLAAERSKEDPANESSEEERKKRENSVRGVKLTLLAFATIFVGSAAYIFFVWGAPLHDQNGDEIKDEFSGLPFWEQYLKRAWKEVQGTISLVTEPSRDKLLPDPLLPPYVQPPYTLLVELTGVLVHPDWTYQTGWRFKKRPGVDYFLTQLAHNFEVVIYSNEMALTAHPIIDALDPQGIIMYRLYRDSTKYENGVHVKDLDKINRDLSKVIVIDFNEKAVQHHRNNAIVLPKWNGNDDDRTLYDLAALLKTISMNEISDVRSVLEHYAKFQDPIAEFRERQRLLALEEQERKDAKAPGVGVSPGWLLNILRKA